MYVQLTYLTVSLASIYLSHRAKREELMTPESKDLIGRVCAAVARGVKMLTPDLFMTVEVLKDIAVCVPGLQVIVLKDDGDSDNYVAVDIAMQPQAEGPLPFQTAKIHAMYWHDGVYFDMLGPTAEEAHFQESLFQLASVFFQRQNEFNDEMIQCATLQMCGVCKTMRKAAAFDNAGVCAGCTFDKLSLEYDEIDHSDDEKKYYEVEDSDDDDVKVEPEDSDDVVKVETATPVDAPLPR